MKKNCGNYSDCVKDGEDLVCVNPNSEYVADYVELSHSCDEWSGDEEVEDE